MGPCGCEWKDSPGPEVRALFDGRALRRGRGCTGNGGIALVLMWYLWVSGASGGGAAAASTTGLAVDSWETTGAVGALLRVATSHEEGKRS